MKLSPKSALDALQQTDGPFLELFQHGSLNVEIYQPEKVDLQSPHDRAAIYVIVSGTGKFINGEEIVDFAPGDCLFVPAGVEHRFMDFTDDFATWVFFYGPEGGESA